MSLRHALAAVCALSLPAAAFAAGETRLSADLSSAIGYANNPFAEVGGDVGSAYVDAGVRARAERSTERSTWALTGNVQRQEYFKRYSGATNYGAAAEYRGRPNERINAHAVLSYDSSVIGSLDSTYQGVTFTPGTQPLPQIDLPVLGTDLALFGTRDRVRTLNAQGDYGVALSARDKITGSAFYINSRYKRFGDFGDYDGYGGTLGYARAISQFTEVGIQGSSAFYDYRPGRGDTKVNSVQATISTKLSAAWTLQGGAGVSFTETGGRSGTNASFSGNVAVCRNTELETLCLLAARAVLPTGFQGTQNTTSISATYRRRVSEHGTFYADASYARNGNQGVLIADNFEYVRTSGTYEHQLSRRLRLAGTLRYRDIFGGTVGRASDYGGQIGVIYRLGDYR